MKRNVKALSIFAVVLAMQTSTVFADVNYPISTSESEQNGYMTISKTYALDSTENPSDINTSDFNRYGVDFTLAEIVKTDQNSEDVKTDSKEIEIVTKTNEIDKILAEIENSIEYEEEGYSGTLTVDTKSINTKINSSGTTYGTASTTRDYYNLPNQDISQFPRTTTSNGATYNYKDVKYTTNVDGSYNAVVTYTRQTSSHYAASYLTKVTYTGEVSKLSTNSTLYTATYMPTNAQDIIDMGIESEGAETDNTPKERTPISIIGLLFSLLKLGMFVGIFAMSSFTASSKVTNKKEVKLG